MNQDRLIELIKEVDEAMARGAPAWVNVQAIRRRAAQKRYARRIGAAAALVMGAALMTLGLLSRPDRSLNPQVAVPGDLRYLHSQSDLLLAQVTMLSEIQHKMNARAQSYQRLERLRRQMAAIPDPRIAVREEVSQAAQTLVASADRLLLVPGQRHRARKTYERVVRLFPENNWAHIARKRLLAMRSRTKTIKGDLP
jgi:hypothetical protein